MFMPQSFRSTFIDVWHSRLDYLSPRVLSLLASNKKVIYTSRHLNFQCQACPLQKSSRLSLGPTGHKTSAPLNLFLVMFGALLLYYLWMTFDIFLFL
jgi:hypothetical protein